MPTECKEQLDIPNSSRPHVAQASAPERRLYDIAEAAIYLQSIGAGSVTEWTVRRLVSSGRVRSIRLSRKIYISRAALDELIQRLERRTR
jgi:hypothetical protein